MTLSIRSSITQPSQTTLIKTTTTTKSTKIFYPQRNQLSRHRNFIRWLFITIILSTTTLTKTSAFLNLVVPRIVPLEAVRRTGARAGEVCAVAEGGIGSAFSRSCNSVFRASSSSFSSSSVLNMASTEIEEGVIASNLAAVQERIEKIGDSSKIRLIAVSKTKPNALLMEAYNAGQRYFGENYVQELCGKAPALPNDIQWNFIGPLQSNKANLLVKTVGLKQLHCVETVATLKLAKKLDKAVMDLNTEGASNDKLMIYLQVNTSGEESKSGLIPGENVLNVARSIREECEYLTIGGLMTIGAPGDMTCFDTLVECRSQLAEDMGVDPDQFDLSMGMSGDFEEAIRRGSTNVRVGSTIFGARDYSNK